VLYSKVIDAWVFVDTRVTFASIQGTSKGWGEFADQTVVWETEVAEFEREPDQVGEEVGGVDAAVDEDGAVDVGVRDSGEGRGLHICQRSLNGINHNELTSSDTS
jgi:hypothetical protein